MDTSNIIIAPLPPFAVVIIHIIKSIILFINHIHQASLNLKIIKITPHKFIQFEAASINASLCDGIKVNK